MAACVVPSRPHDHVSGHAMTWRIAGAMIRSMSQESGQLRCESEALIKKSQTNQVAKKDRLSKIERERERERARKTEREYELVTDSICA